MKEDKRMKKIKWLELVLDLALIAALVFVAAPFVIVGLSPWLAADGCVFKIVRGESMVPTIIHGDTILIRKGIENIEVGDILSFKVGSRVIVHRVVDIQKNPILTFQTKGDAVEEPDGVEITVDQVIGKMIDIIPTSLLMTPHILSASILLPVILFLARIIYRFSKKGASTKEFGNLVRNLGNILLIFITAFSVSNLVSLIFFTVLR